MRFTLSMKNILLITASLLIVNITAAQKSEFTPKLSFKWAPTGLLAGSVSMQGEYNFGGKNSITAKIGVPANTQRTLEYEDKDAEFTMKATSFLAGYRRYLSKKQMRGFYLEPFFHYVHHISEGSGTGTIGVRPVLMNFTNDYDGFGVGAQLGTQFFIGKRVVIDLFLIGPQINASTNNLKAVEVSSAIPWTSVEAEDAERDIKEFIDQFPFIKDKTTVTVNRDTKTVMADFKGALPGFRTGLSIGFAF